MKLIKLLPFAILFLIVSCAPIKVATDYDLGTDFSKYKTYAFYKKGIDKVDISDIDKRRILRAIDAELSAKGMTKSENPDLIVNIFAKSTQKVTVHNDYGYGYGYGYGYHWRPYYYGSSYGTYISQYQEGTLFVDFIDNEQKELVWQGIGKGALKIDNAAKKDALIKEFVTKIMEQYPPLIEE